MTAFTALSLCFLIIMPLYWVERARRRRAELNSRKYADGLIDTYWAARLYLEATALETYPKRLHLDHILEDEAYLIGQIERDRQ